MNIVDEMAKEAKLGKLRPYCYWNISMGKYAIDEVKDGLLKTLEKTGLKRGLLRRSRFKGNGLEVYLETEKGARTRIKVDLYAVPNAKKLDETRESIQDEIDNQKLILKIDHGYYDKKEYQKSYTASLGDENP